LAADQITAKDKEKIDPDPAEAVNTAGQFESEKCGVVNDDHDNGKCAEKIEAGLAFAILKPRINCEIFMPSLRSGSRCRVAHQL
jgi:hypothetical protein